MRHIRNAFAHSKIPITFDTPEVATIFVRINIFEPAEEPDQEPGLSPRKASAFRPSMPVSWMISVSLHSNEAGLAATRGTLTSLLSATASPAIVN